MPNFKYLAKAGDGRLSRGQIAGQDPGEARRNLELQGLALISLQAAKPSGTVWNFKAVWQQLTRERLRAADAELLLEQLAVMLKSGLELDLSLREIAHNSPSKSLGRCCSQLADSIQSGSSLADAFANQGVFPSLICKLSSVGEKTGKLSAALEQSAQYLRMRRQTTSSLLAALAYPAFVAVAAIAVACYLIVSAIPKLAIFLRSMGRDLPGMTQSLLDVAHWLRDYGLVSTVAALLAAVGFMLFRSWPPGRLWIDRCTLKIPILGSLLQTNESHRFSSTMALMLQSGVRLQDALQTAGGLHRNQHVALAVAHAQAEICNGRALSTALRSSDAFSPLVSSMVAVGEKTGDLSQSITYAADHFASQLQRKLTRLSRLVEPAIIVTVGGLVGYVYVAFFMALLSAGGNIR